MSRSPIRVDDHGLEMNPNANGPHAQPADALVAFGATGDLAHKKIYPALYEMSRRGALEVPVIGVASSKWSVEQLHARARESIEQIGNAVDRPALDGLLSVLQYVSGDYQDAATFDAMRPLGTHDILRGQYLGYRDERQVAADSDVETFCALHVKTPSKPHGPWWSPCWSTARASTSMRRAPGARPPRAISLPPMAAGAVPKWRVEPCHYPSRTTP
jgi:hypothetical protein